MQAVRNIKTDKFRLIVCIISLILAFFHSWQYVYSNFNYQCIIRIFLSVLIIPLTFFFGRKAVYYLLIAFSLRAAYVNSFNNYTGFFCLLISCRMINCNENMLLAIYGINEIAALMIQRCALSHIAIHLLSCALWYVIYFNVNSKIISLDLTKDEIRILDELIAGKQQKEISFFNKNTVTKKLSEARKKNHCKSTNELLYKYRKLLEKKKN